MPAADISINAPSATTTSSANTSAQVSSSSKTASSKAAVASNVSKKSQPNAKESNAASASSTAAKATTTTSTSDSTADKKVNEKADADSDFFSTLAALLNEDNAAATAVIDPASLPTTTAAVKTDDADEVDDAIVEAVLLGVQLATTPQATIASSGVTGTDNVAGDPMTSVLNSARSLKTSIQVALNGDEQQGAALTSALTTVAKVAATTDQPSEVQKKGSDVSLTNATNQAMTAASDIKTASETREQGSLEARVGTAKWTDELAAKVSILSQRDVHAASLRLSPEHLGPLEIQITVQNDKTSVWFGAAHAETRAALEQALPRLRELLGSQGLVLTDAGVFREPPRDQGRSYQSQSGIQSSDITKAETDVRINASRALLDAYA